MVATDSHWTDPARDELLATVCSEGPEYGPVVAYEAGVDPDEAERRFRALRNHGLVERVSEEPCYRATELGVHASRDATQQPAVDSRPTDLA